MATVLNILGDWSAGNPERERLLSMNKGLVLRWLNEGQLRFASKSEILRGTWTPVLADDGQATLPDDFIRIVRDSVKWDDETTLSEVPYANGINLELSTTAYYSVWGWKFYVWAAAEGEPTVAYIRKPDEIKIAQINTADLEIPTEYHHDLLAYLDAMFSRQQGKIEGYLALIGLFDKSASEAGMRNALRVDGVPRMHGGML